MARKLLLVLFALGVSASFAAAETFKVTLLQDSIIDGRPLKAGQCKVALENGTATITQNGQSIEVAARVQTGAMKFGSTALTYKGDTLMEIGVGGSHKKIIFGSATQAEPGA